MGDDTDNSPEIDVGDENPKEDTEKELKKMNLTDVNDDCLEEIFKYLQKEELVHIADAHPRFEATAVRVYGQYSCKWYIINAKQKRRDAYHLRCLHHFGHLVHALILTARLRNFDYRLLEAVTKHCGPTLTTMHLRFSAASMKHVKGKKYCRVFLQQLSHNFPNLENFAFTSELKHFQKLDFLMQNFSSLVQISLDVYEHSVEQFKEIIRLNPQLLGVAAHLRDVTLTLDLVRLIDDTLPQLQLLDIHCQAVEQIERFEPKYFKNLIHLSISGPMTIDMLNILAVSSERLQRFEDLCEETGILNYPTDILCRYKQLNELWLQYMTNANIIVLADNLPSIVKLYCFKSLIWHTGVSQIVKQWTKLTFSVLHFLLPLVDDDFLSHIKTEFNGNEWKIVSKGSCELEIHKIVHKK